MPTVVVDALAAHVAAFPAEDDLIFTNEAGDMIRRSNFGTMWRRVTKSVELDGLHFHDLRHYYASLLKVYGIASDASFDTFGDRDAIRGLGIRSRLSAA